jgi:hypothetical protein
MRRNHLIHFREAAYPFHVTNPRIFQTPEPLENVMHIVFGSRVVFDEYEARGSIPRKRR